MTYSQQQAIIENMNYFNDPRVRAANRDSTIQVITKLITWAVEDGLDPMKEYGVSDTFVPEFHWIVCPMCNGGSTVVNPSIDSGGISMEQFDEDPDFAEDYFRGTYDIKCPECNGRTTVEEVNFDLLPEQLVEAINDWYQDEANDHAEHMAEMRMGC